MKKVNTITACGLLSVAMAASVFAGCGEKPVDGTQTAMVIDGEELSLGLVNYYLRTEQANTYAQMQGMMAYFGGDANNFWTMEGEEGVSYGQSFKDSIVTDLTKLVEIRKNAEELGVAVSEDEKQKIQETAAAFMEKNGQSMEKLGVTADHVQEALELKTLEVKIKPVVTADTDRKVSDDEAAQSTCTYVRLKKAEDEEANAAAKEQMEDILKQILDAGAGADMNAIAEAVNEECYSAQYNFNKGAYDDENNVLDGAVKDVLKNLKENEVYDQVIEGESYYFIIRMDHFFDKEKTEQQKETIIKERENELYTTTIEGWTEGIEPDFRDCWDKIAVDDSVIYTIAS
ncbi:MAG: peptidylprolyl isomerase [Lachnospiraceae bacterium]|nr:peptidylprolyl isomerase [Lachnospiraceae bacterium]